MSVFEHTVLATRTIVRIPIFLFETQLLHDFFFPTTYNFCNVRRVGSDGTMSASGSAGPGFDTW